MKQNYAIDTVIQCPALRRALLFLGRLLRGKIYAIHKAFGVLLYNRKPTGAAPAASVGFSILWGCYSQKQNKARKSAPAASIRGQREYLSYLTVEKLGFLSYHHPKHFEDAA